MAISDQYVATEVYMEHVGRDNTSKEAEIDRALKTVSRWIEAKTERHFTQSDSETRLFIAGGRHTTLVEGGRVFRPLEDIVSVSSIKIDKDKDGSFADETALAATDYQLFPLNAALRPIVEPFTEIRLTEWGDESVWPDGAPVEIIGIFGWPAVPEGIQQVCLDVTGILLMDTPRATERILDGFGIDGAVANASPKVSRIIWETLEQFARHRFL